MSFRVMARLAAAFGLSLAISAHAVDRQSTGPAPDLTAIRAKIKAKDWNAAIADLREIVKDSDHADAYNLLAFSLRNIGAYKEAHLYYGKALDFEPDHRQAREYLGELYIKTGEMKKAREQLAILQGLCPRGCEELDDLEKAIAAAPATN